VDGYVSLDGARDQYGVVVDPRALTVQAEETAARRGDG
jgi:hypothetical protein